MIISLTALKYYKLDKNFVVDFLKILLIVRKCCWLFENVVLCLKVVYYDWYSKNFVNFLKIISQFSENVVDCQKILWFAWKYCISDDLKIL